MCYLLLYGDGHRERQSVVFSYHICLRWSQLVPYMTLLTSLYMTVGVLISSICETIFLQMPFCVILIQF